MKITKSVNVAQCDKCGAEIEPPRVWEITAFREGSTFNLDLCFNCLQAFVNWTKEKPEPAAIEPPKDDKWEVFDRFIGRQWLATPFGVSLNKTACRHIANMLGLTDPRAVNEHIHQFEAETLAKTKTNNDDSLCC